jgi:probable phosphoglycerate mutase
LNDAATRLVVIRHGETDWNVGQRIQGQLDIGLNATGRRQAERLAEALAGEALAAIYASDLSRAADTARAVAAATGAPLTLDAALRERAFGVFEGVTFRDIEQRWPDDARRWRQRDPAFGPGGGERLDAFYARSVGAALRLAAQHPGEAIALVAHGGVLDCLYRAAARVSLDAPRTWKLGNAAINRLLHADGGLVLVGWDDSAHLDSVEG